MPTTRKPPAALANVSLTTSMDDPSTPTLSSSDEARLEVVTARLKELQSPVSWTTYPDGLPPSRLLPLVTMEQRQLLSCRRELRKAIRLSSSKTRSHQKV